MIIYLPTSGHPKPSANFNGPHVATYKGKGPGEPVVGGQVLEHSKDLPWQFLRASGFRLSRLCLSWSLPLARCPLPLVRCPLSVLPCPLLLLLLLLLLSSGAVWPMIPTELQQHQWKTLDIMPHSSVNYMYVLINHIYTHVSCMYM